MKIEKICEYLNEIGILEYENINIFLDIYSKLNNGNYTTELDKIRDTLIMYLNNNFIKNNSLPILCQSIVSSYNNYQLILKYRTINNMKNILFNKIKNNYINFFFKFSLFLLKKDRKSKRNISKRNSKKFLIKKNNKNSNLNEENNENNSELISSDDERECTFTPQINKNFKGYKKTANNPESNIYYSPSFNIISKYPINGYQNYFPTNNNYSKVQRNKPNNNINQEQSYYSNYSNNYSNYNNYNNLNISNDSRSNRSYKIYENNIQNKNINYNTDYIQMGLNKEFLNNDYYQEYNNNNNYRILNNNYNNEININYSNSNLNNGYLYSNLNNSHYSENNNRSDDFFNKEMIHIQKVKDKIQNMKIEKMNKIKEECTFEPKINTNYKSFYSQKNQNVNPIYQGAQNQQIQLKTQQKQQKSIPINNNQKNLQIKPKIPLEVIKENENIMNKTNMIPKEKKEKKKRSYSEKKRGLKIIEDLSLARKRRTEKTKKLMKERNFTPKIRKSDKYKDQIKMTFEERRLKSIELKNKYKNAKKDENINLINEENILAPGEMVRFIENKNSLNQNNNESNNNLNNEEFSQNLNLENNNKEDPKEIVNNKDDKNIEGNNSINNNINNNEMEKNRILMLDKIKGEHKIGFKYKKEDIDKNNEDIINKDKKENINTEEFKENYPCKEEKENEILDKERNDEVEKYFNSLINNKNKENSELSFNSNNFHSNALKEILNKNKND